MPTAFVGEFLKGFANSCVSRAVDAAVGPPVFLDELGDGGAAAAALSHHHITTWLPSKAAIQLIFVCLPMGGPWGWAQGQKQGSQQHLQWLDFGKLALK
jgi:hypothetical protein